MKSGDLSKQMQANTHPLPAWQAALGLIRSRRAGESLDTLVALRVPGTDCPGQIAPTLGGD